MENRKVVNYELVKNFYIISLAECVKELILKGWQPYGNPFLFTTSTLTYIVQAMVIYEEAPITTIVGNKGDKK